MSNWINKRIWISDHGEALTAWSRILVQTSPRHCKKSWIRKRFFIITVHAQWPTVWARTYGSFSLVLGRWHKGHGSPGGRHPSREVIFVDGSPPGTPAGVRMCSSMTHEAGSLCGGLHVTRHGSPGLTQYIQGHQKGPVWNILVIIQHFTA